ncbi:hypothetical protein [Stenotrophomonas maltophilia]|uniref:hypothetical protein n=1 Tax=Stenotrophomonas maltophilia TaxID=40324 RepID=UPI0013DA8EAD|nr:hypothetical protein [Stenotrophomonas maltophilia]MBN4978691.1 hypothetical protein [Stenotrophomonas maltophilia]MDG9939247.1 hypothetical protein [Stenotrophomonas maltophilia]MDH0559188.1 hypothetical protein [Stenotrophomonas maltophilia]NRP03194.1 hypothetical protein [Stenotrophomonas maltophilia]HEL5053417.1 hypothetical protein [Stenotrophomonas maltophilia]
MTSLSKPAQITIEPVQGGYDLTLILLGHEFGRTEVRQQFRLQHKDPSYRGLFAISDSALSSSEVRDDGGMKYTTLFTGIEKVNELKIQVGRPDILRNGHFTNNFYPAHQATAFLAFAGNANEAHHVLASIREDLENLHLSFRFDSQEGEPKGHIIIPRSASNPMSERGYSCSEDTFDPDQVQHLYTADLFVSIAAQAIQRALQSSIAYSSTNTLPRTLSTYALGIWCPVLQQHNLYRLTPRAKLVNGRFTFVTEPEVVPKEMVLALGTKVVADSLPIQETYDKSLAEGESTAEAMVALVDEAVDKQFSEFSGRPVDRPINQYRLNKGLFHALR